MQLRSRRNNDFSGALCRDNRALTALPDETVRDGEVVALDAQGRAARRSTSCRISAR